jgi:pilus assembly protein FimV
MIRKLAIALSLLGACFTGFVHALGLGEVTVKSALNQPLNAQIELVNTAGLTIDEILPGLATREEFQKANVDRVYFLSDLRFEVITSPQGKAVIVLTSRKPVREPFLNFIVELIWPSGRLLREYALLIDPPLFSEQPIAKVSTPSASSPSTGDVLNISSAGSATNTRPLLAPSQKIETSTYGATDANDTLWDIALKARPNRSVSPQQVMLAIQDLNSDAFIDNNINKLKAGQVLRLPTLEQIKQRSQHQAIIGVIAQNEAHLGKRTPSVIEGSKTNDPSKARTQERIAVSGANVSGDELKLVVSENNSPLTTDSANSGQSNQTGSGASTELAITLEKLDKASIENKELNSRVGDLEEQLSTLQRLLTLKNDQLASIQSQMRANELEKLKAQNEEASETEQTASEADTTEEIATTETIEESKLDAELGTSESLKVTENKASGVDVSDEASAELALVQEPAPVEAEVIKKSAEIKGSPEVAQQNLIQTIINNPVYLSVSVLIVLVLVFLLWMVSRYNAKREEEFQAQNGYNESLEQPQFNENAVDSFDEEASDEFDAEAGLENDDSFESSEDEDAYAEETEDESQDVLAEVNAYISYGRLDQAAQVLEKAISQEPVRTDYRLKLLHVYKELGDRQAFDRQFSELEAIQDSSALKAAEKIKNELLDEESLQFDVDSNDLDSDLDDQSDLGKSVVDTNTDADEDLDEELKSFDFDSVSLEEDSEDIDLTTELDLESLDIETEKTASKDDDSLVDASDESLEKKDTLELDSDSLDAELSVDEDLANDDFDDSILDIDLEDLDLSAELDQETEIALEQDLAAPEEPTGSADEEELVVSDDILEEAAQAFEEDALASTLDEDLSDADEFDFLNGTDEASTKLDLARAYIDMGDIDGAKDILQEVTKEGSEAQQAEAKELLDSID